MAVLLLPADLLVSQSRMVGNNISLLLGFGSCLGCSAGSLCLLSLLGLRVCTLKHLVTAVIANQVTAGHSCAALQCANVLELCRKRSELAQEPALQLSCHAMGPCKGFTGCETSASLGGQCYLLLQICQELRSEHASMVLLLLGGASLELGYP